MARKEDNLVGQEGLYKLTYKEGGDELVKTYGVVFWSSRILFTRGVQIIKHIFEKTCALSRKPIMF